MEDQDRDNDGIEDRMDRCPFSPKQYNFVPGRPEMRSLWSCLMTTMHVFLAHIPNEVVEILVWDLV